MEGKSVSGMIIGLFMVFWATLRDWPHQAVPSEPDTFLWGPSNSCSGIFSTKKTWEFFRPRAETKEWSQMWGLMDSGVCTLCSTDQESRDHLFNNCRFAAGGWDRVKHKLGSPGVRITSWNDLIEWLLLKTGSVR
ncbi:hypothetical protein F2Q69_00028762 [Brassica cretica]|uniref:Reverse transcriptase zinc-binding domain-containing protein n=1 Tax=Brassica cretica TaxID=69181 RepID=A0A8S9S6P8_BRACR|nr:hypothetical protein F2Q69_00028762 [Brassica cretica]